MSTLKESRIADFRYDLFLSYNHHDRQWVERLATTLQEGQVDGGPLKIFYDEWGLQPGENIPLALENALRCSRKIGIVVSPDSLNSDWVQMERSAAIAMDPSGRDGRIIPLFLRGNNEDLPALLAPLKYIDFRLPQRFEEGVRLLISAVKDTYYHRTGTQPPSISDYLRTTILSEMRRSCAICHSKGQVDLATVEPNTRKKTLGYDDVIPLCPECHERARLEEVPAIKLRNLRDTWRNACQKDITPAGLAAEGSEGLDVARRLLLTAKDIWDVKRAKLICDRLLHQFDPFNVECRLLHAQATRLELSMERDLEKRDSRHYANQYEWISRKGWIASLVLASICGIPIIELVIRFALRAFGISIPQWVMLIAASIFFIVIFLIRKDFAVAVALVLLLPIVLVHEAGHIIALYVIGSVRNAAGKRMPLLRYFRYIEIDRKPFLVGLREALKEARSTGRFPLFSVNESKLRRDWFSEVSFSRGFLGW